MVENSNSIARNCIQRVLPHWMFLSYSDELKREEKAREKKKRRALVRRKKNNVVFKKHGYDLRMMVTVSVLPTMIREARLILYTRMCYFLTLFTYYMKMPERDYIPRELLCPHMLQRLLWNKVAEIQDYHSEKSFGMKCIDAVHSTDRMIEVICKWYCDLFRDHFIIRVFDPLYDLEKEKMIECCNEVKRCVVLIKWILVLESAGYFIVPHSFKIRPDYDTDMKLVELVSSGSFNALKNKEEQEALEKTVEYKKFITFRSCNWGYRPDSVAFNTSIRDVFICRGGHICNPHPRVFPYRWNPYSQWIPYFSLTKRISYAFQYFNVKLMPPAIS